MYSTALAAICDHSDPTWRSSALGTYRFWRDLGYAIGALVTGAVADWIGILWSIGVSAFLTALSVVLIWAFYKEVEPDDNIYNLAPHKAIDQPAASTREIQMGAMPMPAQMTVTPAQMNVGQPFAMSPPMMPGAMPGAFGSYPSMGAQFPTTMAYASGFGHAQ